MKTVKVQVYKLNELLEKVQDQIISTWRENDIYPWHDENVNSLNSFADLFNVHVTDFEYGYHNYISWHYHGDDYIADMTGPRLKKYIEAQYPSIKKDFPFTGYYIDEELLDPLRSFLKYPSFDISFHDLLNDCLESWVISCRKDYEYWCSEECIKEDIESNGYYFTAGGKIFYDSL